MSEHPLALQVERTIYLIRGAKVILDYDLASLYHVETRALNQSAGTLSAFRTTLCSS